VDDVVQIPDTLEVVAADAVAAAVADLVPRDDQVVVLAYECGLVEPREGAGEESLRSS
jgi:hypothetical protein